MQHRAKIAEVSRRSRKRGSKSAGGSKWLIAAVSLILVLVVAVGVVHTMIRRYLQSDEFRIFLSDKVSESINAKGEFKQLNWDGLEVRSEGFEAEGNGQIVKLDVQGLQTEVGLGGFWRGVWEVEGFEVRQVDIELDARSGTPPAIQIEKKPKKDGLLPSEVEVKSMRIGYLNVMALLDSGSASIKGARLEASPGSGRQNFDVKLTGGDVTLPGEKVPKLRLEEANLKTKDGAVFITDSVAKFWDRGRIEMTGEWDPALDIRAAQGHISGVTCSEVVNEDWSKRLRGKLSTDFQVNWVKDEPHASGHLVLTDGVLTALPILEVMEAYLDTTRFRVLTLNEAHTDWRWREGQWSIHNFVIASEGLMRLEGEMRVTGENIDGNFRLGLAPGTLARIPGAEEHVFLAGERGLRWAPVRVTGTLKEPKHDLTDRLLKAAGRRLLEALPETAVEAILLGKGVVDHSTQKALQEGIKLLGGEEGQSIDEVIQQGVEGAVEGVLKGIFGGGL